MKRNEGKTNEAIGCCVTSCRYNGSGEHCELEHIEIMPCCGCGTGKPDDESFCGSFVSK